MTAPVTGNLFAPPADVGIIIAMGVKGHQLAVPASSTYAGAASFGAVPERTNLGVIRHAIKEEVSDVIEERTLPKVVIGKLSQSFEGRNIKGVVIQTVSGSLGPSTISPGPMGVESQERFERIGEPGFGIRRLAGHR